MHLERFYKDLESLSNYDPSDTSSKGRVKYFRDILIRVSRYIGQRVLDLACGGGIVSIILGEMGREVIGVDIQDKMLEVARRHVRNSKKVKFVKMDITNLNIGEVFDTVLLMGNSIVHFSIRDFESIINGVKKHLKKGGYFILEYSDFIWEQLKTNKETIRSISGRQVSFSYNYEEGCVSILIVKKKIREDLFEAERHCYYLWSPWIVRYILEKNGFKLKETLYSSANTFVEVFMAK